MKKADKKIREEMEKIIKTIIIQGFLQTIMDEELHSKLPLPLKLTIMDCRNDFVKFRLQVEDIAFYLGLDCEKIYNDHIESQKQTCECSEKCKGEFNKQHEGEK